MLKRLPLTFSLFNCIANAETLSKRRNNKLFAILLLLLLCGSALQSKAIEIVNAASGDATLSSLAISSGNLSPAFSAATNTYTATVPGTTNTFSVTPATSNSAAHVAVNGSAVSSGTASAVIPLTGGPNIIIIMVTSQDGKVTQTYTVTVERDGPNLSGLLISSGTLSPAFTPDSLNYIESVPNATISVTLTPTTIDSSEIVSVAGSPVTSGSTSAPVTLNVGSNIITNTVNNTSPFSYPASFPFKPFQIIEKNNQFTTSIKIKDLVAQRIAVLKPYYVDYINGTDNRANGAAPGTKAYKTIRYAVLQGASLIYVAAGTYLQGSWGNIIEGSAGDVFIIGAGADKTFITNSATTPATWTNAGGNTYTANIANGQNVIDMSQRDAYGFPLKLQWVASAGAVATTPNSVYISSGTVTINLSRAPDANILTVLNTYNAIYQRDAGTLYVEGLTFIGGYGMEVQPNTILSTPTLPQLTSLFNSCQFIDGGDGLSVVYPKLSWADHCTGSRTQDNGFGYNVPFNNKNYIPNASFAVETNCQAFLNGEYPYTGSNANGSSAHYGVVTLRIGCTYYSNYGPNYIDVGNTNASPVSLLIGCASSNSLGHFNNVKNGYNTGFAVSTSLYNLGLTPPANGNMWLYKCSTNNDSLAYSVPDQYSNIYTYQCATNSPLTYAELPNVGTITEGYMGTAVKNYTINVIRAPSAVATLSSLTVSNGSLTPVFSTTTTSYSINLANAITSITVTPIGSAATASITVNGTAVSSGSPSGAIALNVGANTITTAVTAQDDTTTKTYTVTVTRAPAANANLSALGLVNPTTAKTTVTGPDAGDYTASVSNATTSIEVIPTTAVNTSIVKVNGVTAASGSASSPIPLNAGPNTITTIVKAQDGVSTKTYVITVTRAPSNNANLSALKLVNPTTAKTTVTGPDAGDYTASVSNATTSIEVIPTTAVNTSTVKVNGVTVASSSASSPIPLNAGPNTITTIVKAQDGVSTKTYVITVTRAPSTNANLSALKLVNPTTAKTTVTGPDAGDYTASVANATTSIAVIPTSVVTTSTIAVNGVAVLSGATSSPISLSVGSNTITTVVTAQDGVTTKTYVITVTRAAGSLNTVYEPVSESNPTDHPQMMGEEITVHQALSPNGDGINDFLLIDGISNFPDNKLQIISRSGALVFEAKGYDNSAKVFDGHSNKNGAMQLPGTYFYQLDYAVNGITKHKTGFIVLKY